MTAPPIIKCPFCEHEAEDEKWLEHHIQYTLKPNHPKIEEYLRGEHKPKLIQEQKSLPGTVALSDSEEEEEEKDKEIIEEVEEEKLNFVSLSLDARRILINDSPTCNSYLPKNISSHDANQRRRIVEGLILKACSEYNVDYVSEDNITRCAREVVEQMYQRFRALQKQEREEKKGEDTKTLLAERSEMDERTRIISYLTGAVMNTVHVKTLLDTGEMLYYDRNKNIFRFGGERIIDMEIEKLGGFGVVTNGEKYEVRKHIADNTGVDRGVFDESANPLHYQLGELQA